MALYLNLGDRIEINRELVLSTCHIPAADAKILDNLEYVVEDFGYRLDTFLGRTADEIRDLEDMAYRVEGLSGSLFDLLVLAREYECRWLVLDGDGPEMSTLPKFEW